MTITIARAAIVGATGPTGRHLATALHRRGVAVLAVSRSREKLGEWFPEPETVCTAADARDLDGLQAAIAGCDLVVDCIGLPLDRMDQHEATARNVAAAAATGTRVLHVASFWSFLPVRSLPIDEDHRCEGGNQFARARRAAEDVNAGRWRGRRTRRPRTSS